MTDWGIEFRLRWRLRRELGLHRQLRRRALRAGGANWLQAWRESRLGIGARRRAVRGCLAAMDLTLPERSLRRWVRLPGVAPMVFLGLALPLLLGNGTAGLVSASLLERLPYGPSNALWACSPRSRDGTWPGVTWAQFQAMRKAHPEWRLAAFRYEHVTWDGHYGQQPITVVGMTPNLPEWLGIRTPPLLLARSFWREEYGGSPAVVGKAIGLDNREVQVAGVVPERDWYLFPEARAWVALPHSMAPSLRVMVVAPSPLPGMAARPLPQLFLLDLSYALWGWAAVLGVWLILALLDMARLARRQGMRCLGRALGYWAYALVSVACLGVLLLALCGDWVESWPDAGVFAVLLTLIAYLLLSLAGLRWCLEDQRYRCRTCLRRLRMPLNQGNFGGILLTAPATEYICPHGHGRLLVPGRVRQTHPAQRWWFAGDWWQDLLTSSKDSA